MGDHAAQPEYTGIDKYPGVISTIIALVIGSIFIGALFISGSGDHGGDHDAAAPHDAAGEHAPAAGEGGH